MSAVGSNTRTRDNELIEQPATTIRSRTAEPITPSAGPRRSRPRSRLSWGLTITGGGLLITLSSATSVAHRVVLAAVTTFLIIMLVLAATHALATQTAQHEWARPNAARYRTARAGLGDDLRLETLGALTAAARHNATIAEWKNDHLQQAARTLTVALVSFVLTPLVLLVGALFWGAVGRVGGLPAGARLGSRSRLPTGRRPAPASGSR